MTREEAMMGLLERAKTLLKATKELLEKQENSCYVLSKNTVFKYPCGRSKLHPTEKNHDLLKELILDNSNEGDIVFDPCSGSGSHLLVAKENNRNYLGVELNKEYFKIACNNVLH